MQVDRDALLIDDVVDAEADRTRPLSGWARAIMVAGGAALGLAGFAGVGHAATPDADTVHGLTLDNGGALDGTLARAYGTLDGAAVYDKNGGKPAKNDASKTVKNDSPPAAKNDASKATRSDSPKTAKSPKTPKSPTTANTANTPDTPRTANTALTPDTPDTPGTANSPVTLSPDTFSPNTVSPQTVTPSPVTGTALERNGGLRLGQLFHGGELPESRATALATLIGVEVDDLQQMSLGEVLRTAHAGGRSTQEVAAALSGV